jgi:dihydrofolate reductase
MIAIVAMALNRVIGLDGGLPWTLKGELAFFRRTTMGHVVVMGRKTFDSIGRPLPGRENVVISRSWEGVDGVTVLRSPGEVVEPGDGREIYVIGGAEIYRALLPRCDAVLLTVVLREVKGDTFLPEFEDGFRAAGVVECGEGWEVRRLVRK